MKTRTNFTRALAALTATGLLALGLAACSSTSSDDPNAEAFCKAAKQLESQSSSIQSDMTDLNKAPAALQKMVDTMDVEAPKDISADWNTIKDAFSSLNDALKNMDTTSTDSLTKVQTAASKLSDSTYSNAADKVDTWTSKNCK